MNPLPRRLKKEPLIEVVWQVQFEGEQGMGDILPGVLYTELKKTHPALRSRRLPSADIPAPIAQIDPNMRPESVSSDTRSNPLKLMSR